MHDLDIIDAVEFEIPARDRGVMPVGLDGDDSSARRNLLAKQHRDQTLMRAEIEDAAGLRNRHLRQELDLGRQLPILVVPLRRDAIIDAHLQDVRPVPVRHHALGKRCQLVAVFHRPKNIDNRLRQILSGEIPVLHVRSCHCGAEME